MSAAWSDGFPQEPLKQVPCAPSAGGNYSSTAHPYQAPAPPYKAKAGHANQNQTVPENAAACPRWSQTGYRSRFTGRAGKRPWRIPGVASGGDASLTSRQSGTLLIPMWVFSRLPYARRLFYLFVRPLG
jgi:hypothetical protein